MTMRERGVNQIAETICDDCWQGCPGGSCINPHTLRAATKAWDAALEALSEPSEGMRQAMYEACAGYDAPLHDEMECNDLRLKAAIQAAKEGK